MRAKVHARDCIGSRGWFWCHGGADGPQRWGWYAIGGDGPEPMGWYDSGGDGLHPFTWFWHPGGTSLPAGWCIGGGDGVTPFEGPGFLQRGDGPFSMIRISPGTAGLLSPPWITLWNQIKASIGNDPLVSVTVLDQSMTPYVVHITVDGQPKATAIASVLKVRYQLGNVSVVADVKEKQGGPVTPVIPQSANELAQQVKTALSGNPFYRDVVVRPFLGQSGPQTVYPVFVREVIQFNNDDLSDLYCNYNAVVATVFANVLAQSSGGFYLLPSTVERG